LARIACWAAVGWGFSTSSPPDELEPVEPEFEELLLLLSLLVRLHATTTNTIANKAITFFIRVHPHFTRLEKLTGFTPDACGVSMKFRKERMNSLKNSRRMHCPRHSWYAWFSTPARS